MGMTLFICFVKQNDIYSFQLIKYIVYNYIFNITKNVNGQSANKLTKFKLIAYSCKMSINNMINLSECGIHVLPDLQR